MKENEGAEEKWAQAPLLSRLATRGKTYSADFESHALACLATGASAAEVRELIQLPVALLLAREDSPLPERWAIFLQKYSEKNTDPGRRFLELAIGKGS